MTFPRGRKSRRLSPIVESVRCRRVLHLLDQLHQIGDVIYTRGMRIALVRQTVQCGIHIGDRLILAVSLAGQVADGAMDVVLAQRGLEIDLSDAAKGVLCEERRVRVGVGDRAELVSGVVGVGRGLVVLVGHRLPPPARIVCKRGRCGIRVGDRRQPAQGGIGQFGPIPFSTQEKICTVCETSKGIPRIAKKIAPCAFGFLLAPSGSFPFRPGVRRPAPGSLL